MSAPRRRLTAATLAQAETFIAQHEPDAVHRIPLTRGLFAIIDGQDYDLVSSYSWYATPKLRRDRQELRIPKYYACGSAGRTRKWVSMHRIIMCAPKGLTVDHIDGDGLNNRRSNLRLATSQQQTYNSRRKPNASGYRGVFAANEKWISRISHANQSVYLGRFLDPIDAAYAYDDAARHFHGEFATLNFPDQGTL